MRSKIAIAVAALALVACSALETRRPDGAQTGTGLQLAATLERLPLRALGYRKARGVTYHDDIAAYTVGYAYLDAELDNVVTLYLYLQPVGGPDRLQVHTNEILRSFPKAKLVARGVSPILQGEKAFTAHYATFHYFENLSGQYQDLWSQLLVVPLADRVFVVRSSAPVARGEIAEQKLMQLLNELEWSR
jgi:hypothetical protein